VLRIGVRVPTWYGDAVLLGHARVLTTFGEHKPVLTKLDTGDVFVDWHFGAEQLYTQAQTLEDAVYRINALFEAALQSISSTEQYQ
jgi:hypothetical protein